MQAAWLYSTFWIYNVSGEQCIRMLTTISRMLTCQQWKSTQYISIRVLQPLQCAVIQCEHQVKDFILELLEWNGCHAISDVVDQLSNMLLLLLGCLIPIINTTFIELRTATYLRSSFCPHPILRLNLLTFFKSRPIYSFPIVNICSLRKGEAMSRNRWSSENSSKGINTVDKYWCTRERIRGKYVLIIMTAEIWVECCTSEQKIRSRTDSTVFWRVYSDCVNLFRAIQGEITSIKYRSNFE